MSLKTDDIAAPLGIRMRAEPDDAASLLDELVPARKPQVPADQFRVQSSNTRRQLNPTPSRLQIAQPQAQAGQATQAEQGPALATPSWRHIRTSQQVSATAGFRHYTRPRIDDALSERIFERYVHALDPNGLFLTERDILDLRTNEVPTRLDNAWRLGRLEEPFGMFNRVIQRQRNFYSYADEHLGSLVAETQRNPATFTAPPPADRVPSVTDLEQRWHQQLGHNIVQVRELATGLGEVEDAVAVRMRAGIARNTEYLAKDSTEISNEAFRTFMDAALKAIDPHSQYNAPLDANARRILTAGVGINVNIYTTYRDYDNGGLVAYPMVHAVLDGGSAAKAGLREGDVIVAVREDGNPTVSLAGLGLYESAAALGGREGSEALLTVRRGASQPFNVRVTRTVLDHTGPVDAAIMTVPTPDGDRRVGVIRLSTFYVNDSRDNASIAVRAAIEDLAQHDVDGIVLDLRNNPGGNLGQAIALPGLFIERGPIAVLRRASGSRRVFRDTDRKQHYTGPVAVLINRGSGSASEVTAAALQDYRRAVVIGERSHGKGTAQETITRSTPYSDQGMGSHYSYALSTNKFYRVDGTTTQLEGVLPDVPLGNGDSETYGERTLPNALASDTIDPVRFDPTSEVSSFIEDFDPATLASRDSIAPTDPTLREDLQTFEGKDVAESDDTWLFKSAHLVAAMASHDDGSVS